MRSNLKSISLFLIAVLMIGLLAACTTPGPPQDEDNDVIISEDLNLATGFSQSLFIEDDRNYVEIEVEGQVLQLQVVDEDLFNSLEADEFYIFSYNDEYTIRSIQENLYLRELFENSIDEDEDHTFLQEIVAEDIISMDGLTLLDEYIIDFNNDGYEEIIAMYVAADRDDNNEIMWDDGQRWVFVVHGDNKDYVLYDDYVQLGSIQFNVFTEDDDFYIVTKSVRTASLDISEYIYDEDNDSFIQKIPYSISGNVNMLHSSNY